MTERRWHDGNRWNRGAIEASLAECEPDVPWNRRRLAPPVPLDEVVEFEARFR